MLEWTQQKQWVLPTNTVVQQNILSGGIIEYLEILEDAEFDDEIPFDVSGQDSGETKAQEQEQHIHIINQNHHDNDDDNQDVAINVLGGGGQEDGRSQEAETSERDTKLRAEAPVKLERIELIFFGRIEALKGVYEFCDAVDIVAKNERAGTVPAFDVTFLGNANLGKKDVNEYLNKRAERGQWPGNLKILTDYIQPEAIAYMKSAEGRVAVLASKAENSPYTVLECLALQIPFIASRVGGLPELIFEGDRDKVLFDVNAKSLAKALRGVLQSGVPVVRGTKDPLDTKAEWVAFHEYAFARFQQSLPTPAPSSFAATVERKREKLPPLDKHVHTHYDNLFQDKDRPLLKPQVQTDSALALAFAAPITANGVSATTFPSISVCMPYHDRGTLLFQTIDAMMVQDYPGTFELVIADDGSTDPEALLTLEVIAAELFEKVTLVNTKPAEQQQAEAERRQALEGTPDLARMLASIRDEMDKRIGSTQRRKCKEVRLTILTQPNQYPGKARNEAVLRARYPYVLFLDDDDIPKTYWMSTLMRVSLNTDADVVTSMCDFFKGQEQPETSILRWLTVGGAADLGFFHNVYGAYSALVKRDSFFRIGGYTTEYGTTFEDYEFFATAVLKGFRLENVPHALLWYRQNAKSHLMTSTSQYRNRVRSLRPYLSAVPPMLRNSIVMGYSVGRSKGTTDV